MNLLKKYKSLELEYSKANDEFQLLKIKKDYIKNKLETMFENTPPPPHTNEPIRPAGTGQHLDTSTTLKKNDSKFKGKIRWTVNFET